MAEAMQMIGTSFVLVVGLMVILWLVYVLQKNAGIVDIGWSLGFSLCALAYFILGNGYWRRRSLIFVMVLIWSLRLSAYLIHRFIRSEEDSRYKELKQGWGEAHIDFKVLAMFLFQGLLVILLSLQFILISNNSSNEITTFELWGFAIWLIGLTGETFADWQLSQFKRSTPNSSLVCNVGLWNYSRHPNYFFESIIWIGYFVFALGTPWGWTMVYAPLLMTYLLVMVSGVPLAEAQALRTKGQAYREYQRKTSTFIPWFPKKSNAG